MGFDAKERSDARLYNELIVRVGEGGWKDANERSDIGLNVELLCLLIN